MIELTATIEVVKGSNDQFISATSSIENADGVSDLGWLLNTRDKANPFVGSETTQSYKTNGEYLFGAPYLINIRSKHDVGIPSIYFDVENKGFPTRAQFIRTTSDIVRSGLVATAYYGYYYTENGQLYTVYTINRIIANEDIFYLTGDINYIQRDSGEDISSLMSEEYSSSVAYGERVRASIVLVGAPQGNSITVGIGITGYSKGKTVQISSPIARFDSLDGIFALAIYDWNKPSAPLIIEGIKNRIEIEVNSKNFINQESNIFDRENIKYPSFGVISNKGSLALNDLDGEILDLVETNLLKEGLSTYFCIKNTISGKTNLISNYKTNEWQYDGYDKKVSVSFTDGLEEWQDLEVPSLNYDARYPETKTAKWYYDYLYSYTPTKNNMLSFEELDEETQEILNNTTITYPYLESDNLFAQWNKLCTLCQLHIFNNMEGRTICKYNGGN